MNLREQSERIAEGFVRVNGYELAPPTMTPIPGVGPIIWCNAVDEHTFACRNSGQRDVIYMRTKDGWKTIGPQ